MSVDEAAWCERFLARVHDLSSSRVLPFVWVAGAVFQDRFAVVIYREARLDAPLVGRVYEAAKEIGAFEGSSPEAIAEAAVAGDITDPSGPGLPSPWPWAQHLARTSEAIGWHGPIPPPKSR